jgi:hypothetical protein
MLEPALKETWPNTKIRPSNYLFKAAVKRRTMPVVMLGLGVSRGQKVMVFDTMENHVEQITAESELSEMQHLEFQVARPTYRNILKADSTMHI